MTTTNTNQDKSSQVVQFILTADLGGSSTKAIAQIYPAGVPFALWMSPEVADVGEGSTKHLTVDALPDDSAWVRIGQEYSVLGSIAKREFAGTAALQDLKSEYALSKVAGLLWLAKRQINVDIHEMFLQILLPPGEEKNVQDLAKKFVLNYRQGVITPTGRMKIKVNSFKILPEGTGIISYRNRALGNVFSQKNIGLLMLGHRNASFTLSEKGKVAKKESTDLGMNWVLQKFVERTSVGLSKDDPCIAAALVEASKGNFTALRNLSRRNTPSGINSDLELFKSVLEVIRDEYCRALLRWVKNHVPLDEVLICGGTGEFVRRELTQYFQTESIPIVWNGGVVIPKSLDTVGLGERLADVWATHISYVRMLDENFCYERKQKLVPDSYSPAVNHLTSINRV
ncbi:MAG: ParM/StbA family protein [Nostoc sp. NMS1]|uniref:ParM/StbA family protein n=1 Tax=unclassified Nostoc TaxID=2593658 RepID=UPI000CF36261|nr:MULTISPECIES: ParM/StbA family protein [unclassified Nostoc]AVH74323.1 plasmid segregation protein ParM [Nostoc sp. 'Lobaria pulmonaria (5183) cyanobiont']MBD2513281.1 ParM/StbA family protein [Desmonostoc muscorum FACHB-395]MBN3906678.1 ParM/StbA family protein [Nostoc sp. NMS1]